MAIERTNFYKIKFDPEIDYEEVPENGIQTAAICCECSTGSGSTCAAEQTSGSAQSSAYAQLVAYHFA